MNSSSSFPSSGFEGLATAVSEAATMTVAVEATDSGLAHTLTAAAAMVIGVCLRVIVVERGFD
jgi:hypothetical protein